MVTRNREKRGKKSRPSVLKTNKQAHNEIKIGSCHQHTCFALTFTPHFNNFLWPKRGLAGAPLGVVNASQYNIAGQSDLLTISGLPSIHRCELVLGSGLEFISSCSSLSTSDSWLMLPFFLSWVDIALKKNAAFGIAGEKKQENG